jgi:hypothetical protein
MNETDNGALNNSPVSRLGKLTAVDVRSCWPDEARNFTPWLASPDAIKLLGEALDLELEVEGKEVPVGPYSADILARDLTSNGLVVIENQLERTNHDHFGKALTYAAVLGATTLVWIARTFTEEHRKAMDWLNELTKGDLLLYGIELRVWRIGNSDPAPQFDVVCSPNEIVRQAAVAIEAEELSDTRRLQREFWTEVRKSLERSGRFLSLQVPQPQPWYQIALGRANIHLSLTVNTETKQIGAKVYLGHQVADRALEQLTSSKTQIEAEIGTSLEWNPYPENAIRLSDCFIRGTSPNNHSGLCSWTGCPGRQWLSRKRLVPGLPS